MEGPYESTYLIDAAESEVNIDHPQFGTQMEIMEDAYETKSLTDAAVCEATVRSHHCGSHSNEDLEIELHVGDYSVRYNAQQPYWHDHSTRAAETEGRQPLFKIPAELRNEIYRMVIPTGIVRSFDQAGPQKGHIDFDEPDLLKVNRQIRDESWSIFYRENEFIFHIWGMDASTLVKWCEVSPRRTLANIPLRFDGRYLTMGSWSRDYWWPPLLVWLEQFYYGKCVAIPPHDNGYRYEPLDFAAAMFKEVRDLSAHYHWPYILQVLERKYQAACDESDEAKGLPRAYRTSYRDATHAATVFGTT